MRKRASHQLEDRILALGPSLYWPLNADDTGDSTFGYTDQSGHGRNGSPQGSPTIGGAASLTNDSTDSSTDFNGSSQYITSSYTLPTTGTIVGILNRDTNSSDDVVLADSDTDGHGVILKGGTSDWYARSTSDVSLATGGGVGFIEPFAVTWNSTADTAQVHSVGVDYASTSVSGWNLGGSNFILGANNPSGTPSNFFDGKMSHVAVFDRELTAAETHQLYMAAKGIRRQGLVVRDRILQLSPTLYWPLNYEYLATDLSGNGRGGTAAGAVTIGTGGTLSADPGDASTSFAGGTGDYVSSSYVPFVNGTTRTFFFAGYKNFNSDGVTKVLVSGDQSNVCPRLECSVTSGVNYVTWRPDGNTGTDWTVPETAYQNRFTLGLTFNESTNAVELFANGASKGSLTNAGSYNANNNLRIGSWYNGTAAFVGSLSHFAVWEGALTPTEHLHIAEAVLKGPPGVIIEAAA